MGMRTLYLCFVLGCHVAAINAAWWEHSELPAGYANLYACFENNECPCREAKNTSCIASCNVKDCNYCGGYSKCAKIAKNSLPSNVLNTTCENKTNPVDPDVDACEFTCKDAGPSNETDQYVQYVTNMENLQEPTASNKLRCNPVGNLTSYGGYNCAKGCVMDKIPANVTVGATGNGYNVTANSCLPKRDGNYTNPFAKCTWTCINANASRPADSYVMNPSAAVQCNAWPTLLDGNWTFSGLAYPCIGPCEGFPQTIEVKTGNGTTAKVTIEADDVTCNGTGTDFPQVGSQCTLKAAKAFNISGFAATLHTMQFTCMYDSGASATDGVWEKMGTASANDCVDKPTDGAHYTWTENPKPDEKGYKVFTIDCDKTSEPPYSSTSQTGNCTTVTCSVEQMANSTDNVVFTYMGADMGQKPFPRCYEDCKIADINTTSTGFPGLGNFSTCTNNVSATLQYVAHGTQCAVECKDNSHVGDGPMCFNGLWTYLDKSGGRITMPNCKENPAPLAPVNPPTEPGPMAPPPVCSECKWSDLITAKWVIDPKDAQGWNDTGIPLGGGATMGDTAVGRIFAVTCALDNDLKNTSDSIDVECLPGFHFADESPHQLSCCKVTDGTAYMGWGVPKCIPDSTPPPTTMCNLTQQDTEFVMGSCPNEHENATCKTMQCTDDANGKRAPQFQVDANGMMITPFCNSSGMWESLPTCKTLCGCSEQELCNGFCAIPTAQNTSTKSCAADACGLTGCKKTGISNVKIVPKTLMIEIEVTGALSSGAWVGLYKTGVTDITDWAYGAYVPAVPNHLLMASEDGAGIPVQIPIDLGDAGSLGDFEAKVFEDLQNSDNTPHTDSPTMCSDIVPPPSSPSSPSSPANPSSPNSPSNPASPAAESSDCDDKVAAFWRVLAIVFIILAALAGIIICVLVRKVTSARSDFKELK